MDNTIYLGFISSHSGSGKSDFLNSGYYGYIYGTIHYIEWRLSYNLSLPASHFVHEPNLEQTTYYSLASWNKDIFTFMFVSSHGFNAVDLRVIFSFFVC